MSNNTPDYENDLVFQPASADVRTTTIEKKLEIAIKALEDIERKLLTIDISNLSSRDRDKLYDIMFNDGVIEKALEQIKELDK